jgi:hypothetical protein
VENANLGAFLDGAFDCIDHLWIVVARLGVNQDLLAGVNFDITHQIARAIEQQSLVIRIGQDDLPNSLIVNENTLRAGVSSV